MCGLETAKLALDAIYSPGTESHAWDIDTTLETAIYAAHGNENLEHVQVGPEEGDVAKACHPDAARCNFRLPTSGNRQSDTKHPSTATHHILTELMLGKTL